MSASQKKILLTAAIALVSVAIANRVEFTRKLVNGDKG